MPSKASFDGRWHITSMIGWDDYLDDKVEAYIEFADKQLGSFQFGALSGAIDYRRGARAGKAGVEFTWAGSNQALRRRLSGRGWAVMQDDQLRGMVFVHNGADASFTATRGNSSRQA